MLIQDLTLQNPIYNKQKHIMSRFSRSNTYKIFHLVSDLSTKDSSEKVFLVEEELEKAKRELKGKVHVVGLVGPTHKMTSYLKKQRGPKDLMVERSEKEDSTVDLTLGEKQIAALFIVEGARPQSNQLNGEQGQHPHSIYLCFVTTDEFYYSKPISESSIKYMLIRFMGDLCTNINILYDEKMQQSFDREGCPYTASKKKIAKIKVVKRTERDIIAKQVPCDFSSLYNFDPEYARKLSLTSTLNNKNLLYVSKTLERDFKRQLQNKLKKDQLKLWELIFKKFQSDPQKILLHIQEPYTKENMNTIKKLINLQKELFNQMSEFGKNALQLSVRMYKKNNYTKWWYSETFKDNIYWYIIAEKLIINPQNRTISMSDEYKTVCWNAVHDIIIEVKDDQKLYKSTDYYYEFMGPIVWQAWLQVKSKIQILINQFFDISSLLISTKQMTEEEAINVTLFELKTIGIEKVIIGDHQKILLSESLISDKTGEKIKMKNIESMEVFDLKNSQNSKLICLRMIKSQDNSSSIVLLTYANNDFTHLCSYKRSNILFRFQSENQKGYIINMTDEQVVSFKIDSLERMVEEKTKNFHRNGRKIIDFGVAISPSETIYYLDKEVSALYSIDVQTGEQLVYDCSKTEIRYLTPPNTEKYEYLRVFNEDMYVALGNRKMVDIFKPNIRDGKLILKKSITLDSTFLGVSILSENLNQYLVMCDSNKSKGIVYQNMNCQTMIRKQYEQKNNYKGNPYLDIFYGAKEKFGEYKNYTTVNDNPKDKELRLHHCFQLKQTGQKIEDYLKELILEGHKNFYQEHLAMDQKGIQVIDAGTFLREAQTRIPVQLCTLQNSNIVPLIRGKLQNYHFFKQMSIAQRSKVIEFGIVEQLLKRKPEKRVLVVSIMGAQSTGKSYLMNRLFGTRFTVSSARCTIGIWLSLVETSDVNYLLMDCQGLFAVHRDSKEEQKLIRVLTSISDYTLLNQNMSMTNRALVQLLEQISESVKNSAVQNAQLYKGELFIIVRDVKSNEAEGIQTQFFKTFQFQQKNRSKYIEQLFGGNINLFSVEHFEKKEFLNDVKSIKDHIKTNGMKRPIRTSLEVLESLKVIVNQLTCDDSKSFEDEMRTYKIEKSKDQIMKLWRYGPLLSIKAEIRHKEFVIDQRAVQITQQEFKKESASCLQSIDKLFQQKIIGDSHLKTTEYAHVYKEYNDFLIKFFDQRFSGVQKKIQVEMDQSLKSCHDEKIREKITSAIISLKNLILSHKQKLRLCMEKCSEEKEECSLPCTSKFRHKFDKQSERESARVEKDGVETALAKKQLTEQQKYIQKVGIQRLEGQYRSQMSKMEQVRDLINQFNITERQKEGIAFLKSENNQNIEQISRLINENKKKSQKFIEVIENFQKLAHNFSMTHQTYNIKKLSEHLNKILQQRISDFLKSDEETILNLFMDIEKDFMKKSKEIQLLIEQETKKQINLTQKIQENKVKQTQLDFKLESKLKELKIVESNLEAKQAERNNIIEKYHSFQQILEDKIQQEKSDQKQLEDLEQNMSIICNQQKKYFSELNQNEVNLERISQKLSSPLYSKDSFSEFVLPKIIQLRSMNAQLKSMGTQKNTSSIEKELYQIKSRLVADKLVTEVQNIDKVIEQALSQLMKLEKLKPFNKGKEQKLKELADKISLIQVSLDRITLLREQLNFATEIKNKELRLNDELELNKHLFQKNGYESEWEILQTIIALGNVERNKKQPKQNSMQAFLNKLSKIFIQNLNQQESKLVLNKKSGQIKLLLERKQNEKKDLLDKIETSSGEETDLIFSQLDEVEKEILQLENIIKHQQTFNNQFHIQIKEEIESRYNFQSDQADVFKEITDKNPRLTISINFEEKKVEVEGKVEQSLLEFSENLFEVLEQLSSKKAVLKIQEQEYKDFEKSEFSEEAFSAIKIIVDAVAQAFKKQEQRQLKKLISSRLIKRFEKIFHIDEKNELEIMKQITQTILLYSFKQKNQKSKENLENQKNNIEGSIEKLAKQIKDLQSEKQKLQKEILQVRKKLEKIKNEIKGLNKQLSQIRKDNQFIENQIKQKKKIIKIITDTIESIEKDQNLNRVELENLILSIENVRKTLLNLNNQNTQLSTIDPTVTKQLLQDWRKENDSNSQSYASIQELKSKNSEFETKIAEYTSILEGLKEKIADNKSEQVKKQIEQLLEKIQNLVALKAKLKQIARLEQKFQILKKRFAQIEESSKSLCKCLTNHKCQQLCQAGCENIICEKGAGHKGEHLCKLPNHKCTQKCSYHEKCQKICSETYGHSDNIQHSCNTSHICQSRCKFCDNTCCHSLFDDHKEHICEGKDGCQYSCILCNNKCSSKDHKHDKEAIEVQIWQQNKQKGESKLVKRKFHICDKEHECKQKCSEKGICAYQYKDQIKKWIKNGSERNYNYTEQIQVRNRCNKKISVGKLKHEAGECSCNQKDHKCNIRCPDCGSLCLYKIGHQGKHKTQHRNQEQLLYAAQQQDKQIKVGKTGEDFIFAVGDISLPTRCHSSCQNKGRAHYHLVECKGGNQCLQIKEKVGAKHSPLSYYPYHQKQYDMVLCKIYWQLHNFEPPVAKDQFELCSFVCPYEHEGNKNPFFCKNKAWHSFSNKCSDHTFQCAGMHQTTQFNGLEICFLIDATGSMSRFVDECKATVKQIIQSASNSKKKISVKFGIVGYRDHQMYKSNITISLKKLCQDKKAKLEKLPPKSFHNEMFTSTQFLMMIHQLQKKYEEKKGTENLRQKFTEKQLFIFDYHYPFYFDLASTDDMSNQRKLLSLLQPLSLILRLLGAGEIDEPKLPLKQILSNQLQESLEDLLKEEQLQKQMKDKRKLLQISEFSDSAKTIQFLQQLEADGGGDPPQAVLDGMDAVCKIGWSKEPSILRYIFHLFDAPPHGRIYGTDNGDRYPDGCPCQKTHQSIIKNINNLRVNYMVYPLTPRVNSTLEIFRQSGLKFEKKVIDKDKPEDFGLHVMELICKNIEQNQIMINRQND